LLAEQRKRETFGRDYEQLQTDSAKVCSIDNGGYTFRHILSSRQNGLWLTRKNFINRMVGQCLYFSNLPWSLPLCWAYRLDTLFTSQSFRLTLGSIKAAARPTGEMVVITEPLGPLLVLGCLFLL
jgi:hypothetical protein